jgi:hypothetical protein
MDLYVSLLCVTYHKIEGVLFWSAHVYTSIRYNWRYLKFAVFVSRDTVKEKKKKKHILHVFIFSLIFFGIPRIVVNSNILRGS